MSLFVSVTRACRPFMHVRHRFDRGLARIQRYRHCTTVPRRSARTDVRIRPLFASSSTPGPPRHLSNRTLSFIPTAEVSQYAPFPIHVVLGGRQSGHIFGNAFLTLGRPRGPGKAFKKVGGFRPHRFEGFPGPPEAGQTSTTQPTQSPQLPATRLPFGSSLARRAHWPHICIVAANRGHDAPAVEDRGSAPVSAI